MAYSFDGVDDVITATITAVDTGSWTMCAWIYPESGGENTFGRIFAVRSGSGDIQLFRFDGDNAITAIQAHNADDAQGSASGIAYGEWAFVAATFTSSTKRIAIYSGGLTDSVAALSLSLDQQGSGTRATAGVNFLVGCSISGASAFDGEIEHAFFFKRLLSTAELEQIRLGWRPAPDTTNLAVYLPLTADAKDRSGNGADGTVTGAVLTDGFAPQLPSAPASASSLTATAASADSLTLTPA